MECAEGGVHRARIAARDSQHGIAPGKAQAGSGREPDRLGRDALRQQVLPRRVLECGQLAREALAQRTHEADLADRLHRRKPDAIGREHPGKRMHQHRLHPQRIGHAAGVLASRPAEAGERIGRHIMPARDRDLADRGGHVVDRDGEEAFRDFLERARFGQQRGDRLQPRARRLWVERLVARRAEHGRKEGRVDPPEEQVAVGHGQRPALAVAGRAGIGAGAFRADAEARSVEAADRPAAGCHGVDLHHRRGHANACDHGIAGQLVFSGVVRHIGAGAAHVEPDQPRMAQRCARRDHADHAPRWAGEDRILAAKRADFGQPAVRLHEAQRPGARQARLQAIGVAAQDGGEIGVDHRRIPARDQPDQRRNLVADADLRKAHIAGDGGQPRLVAAVLPAMHQHDGERIEALVAQIREGRARRVFIDRAQHRAVGRDPLVDLDHPRRELFGQHDMAREDIWPRLRADPQGIGKAAGDSQRQPLALALQQRIGGDRGADPQFGNRPLTMARHQPPHRLARGIGIEAGVLGQQLFSHQPPVRRGGDHIGEGAAAIDREPPCCHPDNPLSPSGA